MLSECQMQFLRNDETKLGKVNKNKNQFCCKIEMIYSTPSLND